MKRNKKIVLSTLLLSSSLLLSACGNSDIKEVENWQNEESLGEVQDIEVVDIDSFENADENDIIKKYINIKHENEFKDVYTGTFLKIWNEYSEGDGDAFTANNWEIKESFPGYENYTTTKLRMNKASEIYVEGSQVDGTIKSLNITISSKLPEETVYKYAILSYYILCPDVNENIINQDMETIIKGKNRSTVVHNNSNKRNLTITKTLLSGGNVQIKLSYKNNTPIENLIKIDDSNN